MPLPDPASHARLDAIGVEIWARRRAQEDAKSKASGDEPRVRLSSGEGSWLLVQRRPWDGSHAGLVADITALLGVDQCRFGQWSSGGAAGLAISELAARGVSRVIAFGPVPDGVDAKSVFPADSLDELSASAQARRSLWQVLRPALAR